MRIRLRSLQMRLFAGLTAILALFVVISWGMNGFLLPKYYHYSKEKELAGYFRSLYPMYKGDVSGIAPSVERLEREQNVWVTIRDHKLNLKYDTVRSRFKHEAPQPPPQDNGDPKDTRKHRTFTNRIGRGPSIQDVLKDLNEMGSLGMDPGDYVFRITRDDRLPLDYVSVIGVAANGDYIALRSHTAALDKSAILASRFFLYTGILLVFLSSVFAYHFARKFTGPIKRISGIANRMSQLDFSEKYVVTDNDEIGELGDSINRLSAHLEDAVSDLKEANRRLRDDIEERIRMEGMRKGFIANVSHELKTPISLIQGYAEGLSRGIRDDAGSKEFYCEVIIDEARKMDRLVKQLLNLSKIESGHVKPDRTVFDINVLMDRVARKNAPAISSADCECIVDTRSETMVAADVHMTEQVLTNYLINAIRHVPPEGTITMESETMGNKVRVTVTNTGHGIPEDQLDNIWLSFHKLDKARTRESEGTGLGLSIVKAMQDAQGNACGAYNTGEGVAFWFDLDRP